jgi:F-box protein 18 (helicase)
LVNDFITEEKIKKIIEQAKEKDLNVAKLNEEINLLYVAITRTKNIIHIPEALVPVGFPVSSQIHVLKETSEEPKKEASPANKIRDIKEKAYSLESAREQNKDAYKPWTSELDQELTSMFCNRINIKDMCKHFCRSRSAIRARIKKLELDDLYG